MSMFAVDGLASGLNTTQIISQLMAVERAPITRLQQRQQVLNTKLGAWQDLATKVTNLRTALDALRTPTGFTSSTATSTNPAIVTATATNGAELGALTFRVQQLATSHQVATAGMTSAAAEVGAGAAVLVTGHKVAAVTADPALAAGSYALEVAADGSVTFDGVAQSIPSLDPGGQVTLTSSGGATLTVTLGADGLPAGTGSVTVVRTSAGSTMQGLADAIRSSGVAADVRLIDTGTGATPVRLVVTSRGTGASQAVSLGLEGFTGLATDVTTVREGHDAVLTMGSGAGALEIRRSSNSISDLFGGVTLNLAGADPTTDVTVNVARDTTAIGDKVKAVVDAYNTLQQAVRTYTAYDPTTSKAGPLQGDSRARQVTANLRSALGASVAGGTYQTLNSLGIRLGRDGNLTMDRTALDAALAADLDGVTALLSGTGLFGAAHGVADSMLRTGGLVKGATDSAESQIGDITKRVSTYEDRMGQIEERYRRKFAALESTLSQLKGQADWLTNQISSLNASN